MSNVKSTYENGEEVPETIGEKVDISKELDKLLRSESVSVIKMITPVAFLWNCRLKIWNGSTGTCRQATTAHLNDKQKSDLYNILKHFEPLFNDPDQSLNDYIEQRLSHSFAIEDSKYEIFPLEHVAKQQLHLNDKQKTDLHDVLNILNACSTVTSFVPASLALSKVHRHIQNSLPKPNHFRADHIRFPRVKKQFSIKHLMKWFNGEF